MKTAYLMGLVILAPLAACGSSSGDVGEADTSGGTDDTGVVPVDDASSSETSGACSIDADCTALLKTVTVTPAGCAEAYCNKASATCGLRPVDADLDGFATARCDVSGFAGFAKGNDCDDADKAFFAGKSRDCSALTDGTAITWPTGKPAGECKYGSETCGADGKTGSCLGAVPPTKTPNCASDKDNTCVGKKDSELCGCKLDEVRDCYDGPTTTMGVGPCKGGKQTCIASPTDPKKTVWDSCVGEVVPATKDKCTPADDSTCNGKANEGCGCTTDVANDAVNCKGQCTNGTHTCNTSTGTFTGCVGIVNYSVNAGTGCGGCNYCPGSSCTPPAKITVSGACGTCDYCPGSPACTAPGTSSCSTTGGCAGTWCGSGVCSGPVTKTCAGGSCPAVACSSTCAVHCPAALGDRGTFCFNSDTQTGGFGVTTPIGTLATYTMPSIPSGASPYGTPQVLVTGSQSTTDHCGSDAGSVPMTVTCGSTGMQIRYTEADFASRAVKSMPCAAGSSVTVSHTANGTTCCFGGCGRSYSIVMNANINTCGTTS